MACELRPPLECAVLLVVLAAILPCAVRAEDVVRVVDGDSLVVESAGREVDVRLAFIDAPERDQPFGEQAAAALARLAGEREVRLALVSGGAYRRIVAEVFAGDRNLGEELVRAGLAWVRQAYSPPRALLELAAQARTARRGLWAEPDPMPPWMWRAARREQAGARRTEQIATPPVRCGSKRYCREMVTCEEAFGYQRQCALDTLDGDGIPCEALCRYRR